MEEALENQKNIPPRMGIEPAPPERGITSRWCRFDPHPGGNFFFWFTKAFDFLITSLEFSNILKHFKAF